MRCGGTIADPEADGRPGQDGSAGCGQSGAVAPGRRVDVGMGFRSCMRPCATWCEHALTRCGPCAARATLGLPIAPGLPLRAAGLDQSASPLACGPQV